MEEVVPAGGEGGCQEMERETITTDQRQRRNEGKGGVWRILPN